MDNLCHSLVGAAIGKAGLARRTTLGMSTLVIANNLPDIDVAVFATNTLAMSFRRGWTHGVLAQATLPIVLTGAMLAYDRLVLQQRADAPPPAVARELLLLSYVGVLLHVFMDLMNSYGVRLLMPFSRAVVLRRRPVHCRSRGSISRWALGWWLSRRRGARGARPARRGPPALAVAVAAVYVLAMLASNVAARAAVRDGLERAGPSGRTPGSW